jgi:SAM-dependent methyltransferase
LTQFALDLASRVLGLVPFLTLRFWRLVAQTIWIKWQSRGQGRGTYTDHLVRFYTRGQNPCWEPIDDKWQRIRPLVVHMADPGPGETVLDVATGVGYQAAAFAAAGHRAIGIDYVPDRIRVATARHSDPRLSWAVADASRLPVREDAFDIVSVSLALHDMPVRVVREALKEFRRAARRRVVVIEPRAPGNVLLKHLYIWGAMLVDESMLIRDYLFCDLEKLLEEARLHLVTWQRCFYGCLVVYVCECQRFAKQSFKNNFALWQLARNHPEPVEGRFRAGFQAQSRKSHPSTGSG